MAKLLSIPVRKIYRIKVTLKGSEPLDLEKVFSAGRLQAFEAAQSASNCHGLGEAHLHEFIISGVSFGEPSPEYGNRDMVDHKKKKFAG